MIDIKSLKEQQRGKHPGFNSYLECMTRTFLTGIASFSLGNILLKYIIMSKEVDV